MPQPAAKSLERYGPLLVATVALLASIAGIGNEFVQDDLRLIQENSRVHGLGQIGTILGSPYWPPPWHQELYRPVLTLGHAVQWLAGGGVPLVYRLLSYALYAWSAVLLLGFARRILPLGIALAAALLFAAHPVHVEAVALAVGQAELLVAVLALWMATRYLDRRRTGTLAPRDWALFAAWYAVAAFTKEQGLLIPALLLAVELALVKDPGRSRVRAVGGGFLALGAIAVGSILIRRAVLGGEFTGVFVSEALQGRSLGERALTMLAIVPQWLRLFVWPLRLQADYAPQELVASTSFGVLEGLGAAILAAALASAWLLRRRAPAVTLGVLWLGITLVPVSNLLLPTGFLLAERTLFLPTAGFVIAGAGLVATILPSPRPAWTRELSVAVGVLAVLGIVRSAERQRVWRNEAFFSVRGVQDAPASYRAQRAYGEVLFFLGRNELALDAYRRALALAPAGHAWRVRNDLARRYRDQGLTASEVIELEESLRESPGQEDTRGFLIAGYLLLGRYADAAAQVDSALGRGGKPEVYRDLRVLADSAARVGAPPGSIRIRPVTEPAR